LSQLLRKPLTKLFEITYDDGISEQKLTVPHILYLDESFQKNVIYLKCQDCKFEGSFRKES